MVSAEEARNWHSFIKSGSQLINEAILRAIKNNLTSVEFNCKYISDEPYINYLREGGFKEITNLGYGMEYSEGNYKISWSKNNG